MNPEKELIGYCLCHSVCIKATTSHRKCTACHCGMCQMWGSGAFISLSCKANVSFEGQDNITVYDSSEWAERGFCRQCGSHLFYRIKATNAYEISTGLFNDQSQFILDLQYFIDKKPLHYSFAQSTTTMTEAECLAMFAPTE